MSILSFSSVSVPSVLLLVCLSAPDGRAQLSGQSTSQPGNPIAVPLENWVDSVFSVLTLEEKAGQVIGVRGKGHYLSEDSEEYRQLAELVAEKKIGALVVPQSDVYEFAMLVNRLQRRARVPLLVAADLERGLAMRVRRGTSFPDAMAIGATRDTSYAFRIGLAIAREARALGISQNFAPVADVNTNPANPAINTRSFSDDPQLVRGMVASFVRGTQEGGCIATAKHFPGHGATGTDSHLDLPTIPADRAELDSVELSPFRAAITAGVRSVMVGHLAVPALEADLRLPSSLSRPIVTDLLREQLGFSGLVVTDAMEMKGVVRDYSVARSSVMALQAGADLVLLPADDEVALNAIIAAARSGELQRSRLDDAVRHVLEAKRWAGLGDRPWAPLSEIGARVGTGANLRLASDVARAAITIVKNDDRIIPLSLGDGRTILTILVTDDEDALTGVNRPASARTCEAAGDYFLEVLRSRAGRTGSIRLHPRSDAADFEFALEQSRTADLVLVPIFFKIRTSSGRIQLPQTLRSFLGELARAGRPTVGILFGSPYIAADLTDMNAVVCAYSDAEVSVDAAVEAISGEIDVRGRLPVTIPGAFAFGDGVHLSKIRLRKDDPAAAGFDADRLRIVDAMIDEAIRDSAFPGAQLAIVKDGIVAWNKSYGTYAYDSAEREVGPGTMYDCASLTKVVATTTALMILADRGRVGLDDPVSSYLPAFSTPEKSRITIRHLLTHRSGFPPFRKFWEICPSPDDAIDSVYATPLVATPGDTTIYSDLGFITLGKVVERVSGVSLSEFAATEIFAPLQMRRTMFTPPSRLAATIAPTEYDSSWRRELVRGTVHDENAAFFGGVSGHAGLFSTASDLATFVQMLLNSGTYGGARVVSDSIVRQFIGHRRPEEDRYLGWDTFSPGSSSGGSRLSFSSFGHTGFTGTSIWVDPERKLGVVFLTNRVCPTRRNAKLFRFRPALHDAVISALLDPSVGTAKEGK